MGEILLRGVKDLLAPGERAPQTCWPTSAHTSVAKTLRSANEVAAEIESAFRRLQDQSEFHRFGQPHTHPDKKHIDLGVLAGHQLMEVGIHAEIFIGSIHARIRLPTFIRFGAMAQRGAQFEFCN